MRMVTIFVALIVCGMFFPELARGVSLSSSEGITVNFPEVAVGVPETMSVGITNESNQALKIWLALDKDAACPTEYFTYSGPTIYPVPTDPNSEFKPGDTLNVEVTFEPSDVCVCTAWLKVTPMVAGEEGIIITFNAEGVEKPPEPSGEIVIGTFNTGVLDREDEDGEYISNLIRECQEMARCSGHEVRCISRLTTHLRWNGIISLEEKRAINKASRKAAMSNMMQEIETAKRSIITNDNSKDWWRKWHPNWRH